MAGSTTSKAAFRAVGRALGLTEVGNEKPRPKHRSATAHEQRVARRRVVKDAIEKVRAGHYERHHHSDGRPGSPPPSVPTEVTIPEQSPEPQHGSTGVQAPDKSAEQIAHERTAGRREAIERAFAKSAAAQECKKAAEEDGKNPREDRGKPEEKSAQPREKGRFVSSKPTAGSNDGR
jgi:hypothetical protein